ncbi:MAG TPA: hypothetical protein VE091_06545 [Gemmatimonadales bacterium]|nr:hypothetical protein [Gemmatimonadales bacterium]
MRSWIRPLVSMLVVVALLAVATSCTSDNSLTGPASPEASQPTAQPSQGPTPDLLLGTILDPALQTVLGTLQLLTCSPQPYVLTKAVVGPAGGTIAVGAHRLVIPAGALSAPTAISAEQVRGTTNSVRFQPEGLRFAKPATLTLNYNNCLLPPLTKRVVYTDERLRVLEVIPSLDLRLTRSVNGFIGHFSRYAVAY